MVTTITTGLCLTGAVFLDLRERRIPNFLTLSTIAVGLLYHALWGHGIMFSIAGMVAGMLVLIFAWLMGALGGGDVKLFAAVGSLMGYQFIIGATVWLCLFALIYAPLVLVRKGVLKDGLKFTGQYLLWIVSKISCGMIEREEPLLESPTAKPYALLIAGSCVCQYVFGGLIPLVYCLLGVGMQ